MTKKDFEILATAISTLPAYPSRDEVATAIAVAIMDTNYAFNMPKFLKACGEGFGTRFTKKKTLLR